MPFVMVIVAKFGLSKLSFGCSVFNNIDWQGFIKPYLSVWVSEINANLLHNAAEIPADMPLRFDWKQVFLRDFVFWFQSEVQDVGRNGVSTWKSRQHSQPAVRALAWLQGRAPFYVCCKTKNGLNNRRRSIDKRSELDCENRPIYTQNSRVEGVITACRVFKFSRKVPKGICTSCLAYHMIRSWQEVKIRALSERDWSESRARFCSCSVCNSCLLLDAWPVSTFISISLSSQCWWWIQSSLLLSIVLFCNTLFKM